MLLPRGTRTKETGWITLRKDYVQNHSLRSLEEKRLITLHWSLKWAVDRCVGLWITLVYDLALSTKVNRFLSDLGLPQIELEHETETCNADTIIYNTKRKSDWVTVIRKSASRPIISHECFASNRYTCYTCPAFWEWHQMFHQGRKSSNDSLFR